MLDVFFQAHSENPLKPKMHSALIVLKFFAFSVGV